MVGRLTLFTTRFIIYSNPKPPVFRKIFISLRTSVFVKFGLKWFTYPKGTAENNCMDRLTSRDNVNHKT